VPEAIVPSTYRAENSWAENSWAERFAIRWGDECFGTGVYIDVYIGVYSATQSDENKEL
jgi:hypothetical protein